MELQHVTAKIFVDGAPSVDAETVVKVFQTWISEQSMNELLIDVADYEHVPKGPGIVLVGHQADYSLDNMGGRLGLRYNCKVAREGSNEEKCLHAFRSAAKACLRFEAELPGIRFSRNEFELAINDRAIAPNTDDTRENCESIFNRFVREQLGQSDFQLAYESDARRLVGAVVSVSVAIDFDGVASA